MIPCPHCGKALRVRQSPKGLPVAYCGDCPLQVLFYNKIHVSAGCPGCVQEAAPTSAPPPTTSTTRRREL